MKASAELKPMGTITAQLGVTAAQQWRPRCRPGQPARSAEPRQFPGAATDGIQL